MNGTRTRHMRVILVAVLLGTFLLALGPATVVRAVGVTADLFTDPVPGACATTGISPCSLREAVIFGNAHPGTTITLRSRQEGTYTLAIPPAGSDDATTGDLNITANMDIGDIGPNGTPTRIDGGNLDDVLHVASGATLRMGPVVVTGGKAMAAGLGGGITVDSGGSLSLSNSVITGNQAVSGGGINSSGTLTIEKGAITNNTATDSGGGVRISGGTASILNVLIANNNVPGSGPSNGGGGIANAGSLRLTSSTVSDNTTAGSGGGILSTSALTIDMSTIAFNNPNGIIASGGGVIRASIVARNPPSGPTTDCGGTNMPASFDFNLSDDATCTGFTQPDDQTGKDAKLGPLANNGGGPQLPDGTVPVSHALFPFSPAIDHGLITQASGCAGVDQRGESRPQPNPGRCDIGSYEREVLMLAFVHAGVWNLRNSFTDGNPDIAFAYGSSSDIPLMCDWDGDGFKTPGIFRDGVWALRNSDSAGPPDITVLFGQSGDIPICGDWTGTGKQTIGIFRNGVFALRNTNTTGPPDSVFAFGQGGDIPIVGGWNATGNETIGIYRNGLWALRGSNTSGPPDISFLFGSTGDLPIACCWSVSQGAVFAGEPAIYRGGAWVYTTYVPGQFSLFPDPHIPIFHYGASGDHPSYWR